MLPSVVRAADPPCHDTPAGSAAAARPARDPAGAAEGDRLLAAAGEAYRQGDMDAAGKAAKSAGDRYAAAGCPLGRARALANEAAAELATGFYLMAKDHLTIAQSLTDPQADRPLAVTINGMLGTALTLVGDYDTAEHALLVAKWTVGDEAAPAATAPAAGQPDPSVRLRAGIANNFGNLYSARVGQARVQVKYTDQQVVDDKHLADQREQSALDYYAESARLAAAAGDARLEAKASANAALSAARDIMQQDDPDQPAAPNADRLRQAIALNAAATAKAAALPDSRDKVNFLLTCGQTDRLVAAASLAADANGAAWRHAVRRAREAFSRGMDIAKTIGDASAESYATGYLASVYEDYATRSGKEGDALDAAQALANRAVFLAQRVGDKHSLYRWEWLNARLIARRIGTDPAQREEAIAAYKRATDTLGKIKADKVLGFGNGDTRQTFRKELAPVYYQLADLLLRRSADPSRSDAERRLDLVKARDTIEELKSSELAAYFQDACEANLPQKEIGEIGTGTAIVYYIPLSDRTEILVEVPPAPGTPHRSEPGANLVRIDPPSPVNADELEQAVNSFRDALETRASTQYRPRGKKLYDWLIRPVDALLQERQVDTLVFVPDGALRTIPMAALYDGKQFLIERYAVAVTPGLKLTESQPIRREKVKLLVSALSESVRVDDIQFAGVQFAALENVPTEVRNIQQAFGPRRESTLMNEQYVYQNVQNEIRRVPEFSIVHIASHGEFKGDVKNTFLLTYAERMSLNGLEHLIAPKKYGGDKGYQPVDLLTLSACQTAAGDDRAALGLAGVAIKAGARSAVASLWYLNDSSSTEMISEFYRQLVEHPDLSKAKAMQNAQLSLLHDPDFQHPLYWGPYLMIGNWQ